MKVWITAVATEEVFEVYHSEEAAKKARREILDDYEVTTHDIQVYERQVRHQ